MFQGSLPVTDKGTLFARGQTTMLFAVKTSSTLWEFLELADGCMQVLVLLGVRQNTRLHNELDLLETEMTKTVVPMKKFFLRLGKIDVQTVDDRNSQRECCNGLDGILSANHHACQKIVGRINANCHRSSVDMTWNPTELQLMQFNENSLIPISLKQA